MDEVQAVALATIRSYLIKQGYRNAPAVEDGVDCPDLEELVKTWLNTRANTRAKADALSSALDGLNLSASQELRMPNRMTRSITNHSSNILSCSVHDLPRRTFDTSTAEYIESKVQCIVTSDASKNVIFTNLASGEVEELYEWKSVVLHVCFHGERMVTCAMDGSVVITDLVTRKAVQVIQDHSKYVVRSALSPNGQYLATISYDKSLKLYSSSGQQYEQIYSISMSSNPETLLFNPGSTSLLYTRREDNYLHYLSLPSLQHSSINLNERQDDHVSFSIVCLTLHPSNVLSLQTDQDPSVVILLPFGSHERLKTIHTASSQSPYSTPRHVWTPDGQHCILNSDDGLLHIVSLNGEQRSLKAHGLAAVDLSEFNKGSEEMRSLWSKERGSSNVRDVSVASKDGCVVLVSVGFDKRIRVGELEE